MNSNSVPTEAINIYNRALEKTNRGDLPTALAEYQKAIKMYPYFIEAYNNMGELYSLMGQSDKAISTYTRALDIEKNYKILLNLGVEYYNSGNYKRALGYFLESVSGKPDYHEGNYYAGLTQYNLRDYKNAEKFLLRVFAADRMHLKANYMLSHIYYEWKDYQRAIDHLELIWKIADNREFINKYYGFCCFHLGRYDDAVKYLKEAILQHPEYDKFKSYLNSLTYENKMKEVGDLDKAIADLEKLMMKNALNLKDVTRLSMLYVFKGENSKAEEIVVNYKKMMYSKKN
ncbi:MAG TPA: tetratricopeptide repeat protein [Spirochaetota bacterium]|nr:tetratricopeptide repeat protein [Spirochaetota bacterium]HPJ35913.1 tetratricopeptide repeat protein [Spirochaetota bacterium]